MYRAGRNQRYKYSDCDVGLTAMDRPEASASVH